MGYNILLIEDEPRVREDIVRVLKSLSHNVDTACDGLEGYELATTHLYDVVILDRKLDDLDPYGVKGNGFELAEKLRREGYGVPILGLSAYINDEDDIVKSREIGINDYLEKIHLSPARSDQMESLLAAKINHLVEQSEFAKLPVTSAGHFRLHKVDKILSVRDRQIPLTDLEVSIMDVFLKDPKSVVSREQLYEEVWLNDASRIEPADSNNTINVHISHINTKYNEAMANESDEKVRCIDSVVSRGYRLRLEELGVED